MPAFDAIGMDAVGMSTQTTAPPTYTITSVTISPGPITLNGQDPQQFGAIVYGTNSPPQAVTWGCTLGTIDSTGRFIAPAPTSSIQTITITATSVFDGSYSGTVTVTIRAVLPPPANVTLGVFKRSKHHRRGR